MPGPTETPGPLVRCQAGQAPHWSQTTPGGLAHRSPRAGTRAAGGLIGAGPHSGGADTPRNPQKCTSDEPSDVFLLQRGRCGGKNAGFLVKQKSGRKVRRLAAPCLCFRRTLPGRLLYLHPCPTQADHKGLTSQPHPPARAHRRCSGNSCPLFSGESPVSGSPPVSGPQQAPSPSLCRPP